MRDSVVFYRSFYEAVKELPPEDFKKSVCAIMNYGLDDKEPESSGIEKTIHLLTKPQIDANNRRYQNGKKGGRPQKYSYLSDDEKEKVNKDRNSQEYIRWRDAVYERDSYTCQYCGSNKDIEAHHKLNFVEYPELRFDVNNGITLCRECHNQEHNSNNPKKPRDNQNEPKENVKEKDNVNVNDKKESIEKKRFAPPTRQDVADYVREKGYANVDIERFIDYYSSNGWMVGKNKMKDWRAAVRNWNRSQRQESTTKGSNNKFLNFDQRSYDYDALEKQLLERSRS